MSSDGMIEFEETRFDDLIDGFIKKHREEWEAFVYQEYQDYIEEWEARRDI